VASLSQTPSPAPPGLADSFWGRLWTLWGLIRPSDYRPSCQATWAKGLLRVYRKRLDTPGTAILLAELECVIALPADRGARTCNPICGAGNGLAGRRPIPSVASPRAR
jgi:hypothetical protein